MMRIVNYIMYNFVVENQLYENPLVSPHDEHWYSCPRPVNVLSFYLELYKNKFKNLSQTSKFKFSFRGLLVPNYFCFSIICTQVSLTP